MKQREMHMFEAKQAGAILPLELFATIFTDSILHGKEQSVVERSERASQHKNGSPLRSQVAQQLLKVSQKFVQQECD